MTESIVLCRQSGEKVDFFDSREGLLEELTEQIETIFPLDEIGIFIDGVSYKINIKLTIAKGWTPCEDCRCCLEKEE